MARDRFSDRMPPRASPRFIDSSMRRRSSSESTGSSTVLPGCRRSSRPRIQVAVRPLKPPAWKSETWIRPGAAGRPPRAARGPRPRVAALLLRRPAAAQRLELREELRQRRCRNPVELVGRASETVEELFGGPREGGERGSGAVGNSGQDLFDQFAGGDGVRELSDPPIFPDLPAFPGLRLPARVSARTACDETVESRPIAGSAPADLRIPDYRASWTEPTSASAPGPKSPEASARRRISVFVPAADPREERESGAARAGVTRGDSAPERAGDSMLGGDLEHEGRIDRGIRIEELRFIERRPRGQDVAEGRTGPLVFLLSSARTNRAAPARARPMRHGRPFPGIDERPPKAIPETAARSEGGRGRREPGRTEFFWLPSSAPADFWRARFRTSARSIQPVSFRAFSNARESRRALAVFADRRRHERKVGRRGARGPEPSSAF